MPRSRTSYGVEFRVELLEWKMAQLEVLLDRITELVDGVLLTSLRGTGNRQSLPKESPESLPFPE